MLYIGYLIIVNGQNMKSFLFEFQFLRCRVVNCLCSCSLCTHQVPLHSLQTAISGDSRGPSPGYTGLMATRWVPMGAGVPAMSPNDHPKPSQGRQNGFGKGKGSKLLCALRPLCVDLDLGPEQLFFLYIDPLTLGGVPGPNSGYPRSSPPPNSPHLPLAGEDFFHRFRAGSVWWHLKSFHRQFKPCTELNTGVHCTAPPPPPMRYST